MLHLIRGSQAPPPLTTAEPQWLSLTDLGRIYGISAVHCGRLLSEAGLRDANGQPSRHACAVVVPFEAISPMHTARRSGIAAIARPCSAKPAWSPSNAPRWCSSGLSC